MVGPRKDTLKRLVDASKFDSVREAVDTQAQLLAKVVPRLPSVIIVPIPTIYPHIRRRGYDHTLLLARQLARRTNASVEPILGRTGASVQHGSSRKARFEQAATAFKVRRPVEEDRAYLLVDDVTTTGASLLAAAEQLRKSGAKHIYVAVTTYQLSD